MVNMEQIIEIKCTNQAAILSTMPGLNHDRMKHIRIRLSFLQDEVAKGTFRVSNDGTDNNLADLLTKKFHRTRFEYLLEPMP